VAAECVDPGGSSRQKFERRELHSAQQPHYNDMMGAECSAHVNDEKEVLVNAMKAYGGSRGTAPLIHNLGRRVVNLTLRMLYPGVHLVGRWVGPRAGPNVLQKKKALTHAGI
jgi:hypothetical protein